MKIMIETSEILKRAVKVKNESALSTEVKDAGLISMAASLVKNSESILQMPPRRSC